MTWGAIRLEVLGNLAKCGLLEQPFGAVLVAARAFD